MEASSSSLIKGSGGTLGGWWRWAKLILLTSSGSLASGIEGTDPESEATLLTALLPGLALYVLDRTFSADQAFEVLDHHLDRIYGT